MSKWTISDKLLLGYVWSRGDYHIAQNDAFSWVLYYGPSRPIGFYPFLFAAKIAAHINAWQEGRAL